MINRVVVSLELSVAIALTAIMLNAPMWLPAVLAFLITVAITFPTFRRQEADRHRRNVTHAYREYHRQNQDRGTPAHV